MIDRKKFFDAIKANGLFTSFKQSQVDGLVAILDKWEQVFPNGDLRWLAYMLGTTYHETDRTMQPIEEYGKGRGRKYGSADPVTKKVYYGRGYVQLTWKANYETMSKLLGVDLVNKPELALNPEIAAAIMFEGMTKGVSNRGDFTGVSLETYFNAKTTDWVNARKIINGLDAAEKIAGESRKFYAALT